MNNIEKIRQQFKDNLIPDEKLINELLDEIEEELEGLDKRVEELEQEEEKEFDPSDNDYEVDLGLDVIYFSFEKDNLLVKDQVEQCLRRINKIPHAEIQLDNNYV